MIRTDGKIFNNDPKNDKWLKGRGFKIQGRCFGVEIENQKIAFAKQNPFTVPSLKNSKEFIVIYDVIMDPPEEIKKTHEIEEFIFNIEKKTKNDIDS